ncbi:MAG: DUF4115 domain-containing protein [Acidobacteriota bacterium]|nr:DUF4115 domain-containing protein [Acidobacteriota bacterium]
MTGVGGELRKERESRNILLQDISHSTKIVLRYLEALEDDRLDRIPGAFFVRGIIRTYAQAIGLDPQAVLEKYRESGLLKDIEDEEEAEKHRESSPVPGRQRLIVSIGAGLVLVAASLLLFFSLKSKKDAPADDPAIFAAPPAAAEPAPADYPAAGLIEEPDEESGLVFEASFRQETWIQVYADGLIEVNGIRLPGATSRVHAEKELLIHLGNAGGFDYTLNGRRGRSFGRSGAVVKNILITPENMSDFLADPEPEKNGKPSLRP